MGENAQNEIQEYRRSATGTQYQLDWRWVERYRELAAFDGYWWQAPSGPFTEEERQEWSRLFSPNLDQATKERLARLIDQARERELNAAIAEQRQPHLTYPAIDIEEVRHRITTLQALMTEINEQEPHALVRRLYIGQDGRRGTIGEEMEYLRLIEATYAGDSAKFWDCNVRLNPVPTAENFDYALSRVRSLVVQGLVTAERGERLLPERRTALRETSTHIMRLLGEQLHLPLDWSYSEAEAQALFDQPSLSSAPRRMVSAETAKRFYEAILQECGYEGWQVEIDPQALSAHIEQGLCRFYLPAGSISLQALKDLLTHELAVHVARCVSGRQSMVGLLGIHSEHSLETEEGLGVYYETEVARRTGQAHEDTGIWLGTLATGLAAGVKTPPQRFLNLYNFCEALIYLYRLLNLPYQDVPTAQSITRKIALTRCIRTFRGVPDLQQAGICYTKDAHYLAGLHKIERAIGEHGESILDELAAGVIAVENLPLLEEIGIVAPPQRLRQIIQDPGLDARILSFEESSEELHAPR